jgi:hypothetical protein
MADGLVIKKVKVKLSLSLIKHHVMKTYWGGGIVPHMLDLGTSRSVVSFTHPATSYLKSQNSMDLNQVNICPAYQLYLTVTKSIKM